MATTRNLKPTSPGSPCPGTHTQKRETYPPDKISPGTQKKREAPQKNDLEKTQKTKSDNDDDDNQPAHQEITTDLDKYCGSVVPFFVIFNKNA